MDRAKKLESLRAHPIYTKLLRRLSQKDLEFIDSFLETNKAANNDVFTIRVNRLFVDDRVKPKSGGMICDVLLACRVREPWEFPVRKG